MSVKESVTVDVTVEGGEAAHSVRESMTFMSDEELWELTASQEEELAEEVSTGRADAQCEADMRAAMLETRQASNPWKVVK